MERINVSEINLLIPKPTNTLPSPSGIENEDALIKSHLENRRLAYLAASGLTPEEQKIASEPLTVINGNRKAIECADRMITSGNLNLFLTGKAGRGKSRIAHTIVFDGAKKSIRSEFWTTTRFLLTLKAKTFETDEIQAMDEMLKPKILALDDFGTTKITEWNLMMMDTIFDDWYRSRRSGLVITSNFSISEISQNISDRIASRIAEMCEVIEVAGDDWRLK